MCFYQIASLCRMTIQTLIHLSLRSRPTFSNILMMYMFLSSDIPGYPARARRSRLSATSIYRMADMMNSDTLNLSTLLILSFLVSVLRRMFNLIDRKTRSRYRACGSHGQPGHWCFVYSVCLRSLRSLHR